MGIGLESEQVISAQGKCGRDGKCGWGCVGLARGRGGCRVKGVGQEGSKGDDARMEINGTRGREVRHRAKGGESTALKRVPWGWVVREGTTRCGNPVVWCADSALSCPPRQPGNPGRETGRGGAHCLRGFLELRA